ncbi:uncharacterized protein PG986_015031 [Apiospora aurea]|uniref:Magnesium transporter n=1 Tax=Apiospora aurea TaxID=335848 RepID=A0ABR1PSF4_9PEZI
MDLSTASEASDAPPPEPAVIPDQDIKVENAPAIVRWRDSNGASKRLTSPVATPLGLVIDYDAAKGSACLKLQAAIKMKRSAATSRIFLSIKPSQIRAITCDCDDDDDKDRLEEEQAHSRDASDDLQCRVQSLHLELDSPPTLIAPIEHPFQSLRRSSQELWTEWNEFARSTTRLVVYFSVEALPRERLLYLCEKVPRLASPRDDLASLYGGRGGLVVNSAQEVADAPPAYTEQSTSSICKAQPPLALSPKTVLEGIQRSLDMQNMMLAKILERVERMEGRLEALESRDLTDDVQTCMEPLLEPLWDELDSRIVASEDKTHDYVKDTVDEAVNEKVGDLPELVHEYFQEDEGRGLLHDAISEAVAETVADVVSERDERIREDTMNFLRSRPFTAQFSFNDIG